MAERTQTYKNHARFFPPFHFFVLPVLLLNLVNTLRHVWLAPNRSTAFAALVAAGVLMLAFSTRAMAVAVQDRVIRLEMRLRLRGLLPASLSGRINELTPRQLVALRFASDAELPDMVRDVLDGKLATQKAIKMRVKDWQADWLRA
jgi:Family of unknown function (DUF6526)